MRPLFNSKAVALVATATAVAVSPGGAKAATTNYLENAPIAVTAGTAKSTITLTGISGRVTKVEVSLHKVSHTRAQDRFSLSEPATVSVRVQRRRGGRWVTRARVERSAQTGANRARVRLRSGRNRVVLRATDAAGNSTTTKRRKRVARKDHR